MKNLKKTLAVVTAIAAMTASVPAFAATTKEMEDGANMASSSFNEETFEVTATVNAADIDGGEMSFVVLDYDANETNVAAEDILYIDQHSSTEGATFAGKINRYNLDELPVGDYKVKIGYNSKAAGKFTIALATLKVQEASTGKTVTIVWGDINSDGFVTTLDALEIVYKGLGSPSAVSVKDVDKTAIGNVIVGNTIQNILWGDVNSDGFVTTLDALEIVYKGLGSPSAVSVKGADKTAIGDVIVGNNIEIPYNE